ncbi:MAG: MarR family transcriptional regulator [Microbacteriaceae bacterium]|nr:MarR family transcriptional regulator [Microbacteriaceae bacterium]
MSETTAAEPTHEAVSSKNLAINAWEALFRAQVAVLRDLNEDFPGTSLSFNEYDVMLNLSRQPQRRARIRELNRHLLLTQPSVSRLIDRLALRGLLSKEPDPCDRRGTIVRLTDEGYALFLRVATIHAKTIRARVGGPLSADELRLLSTLCEKLRQGGIAGD